MKRAAFVFFFAFLLASATACMSLKKNKDANAWPMQCGPIEGTGLEYCEHETGGKVDGTLFYFHGLADSVKTIVQSIYPKDDLIDLIKETQLSRVVVLSYGKNWMLKPRGDGPRSVFEIERVIRTRWSGYRVAMGISMGGSNVATLCMQRADLFHKCVLMHPMIVREDQYNVGFDFLPGFIVDNHFSRDEWRSANLFAQLASVIKITPTFITACERDGFKLFPNADTWAKEAIGRGLPVTYRPNYGDCEHSKPSFNGVLEFIN